MPLLSLSPHAVENSVFPFNVLYLFLLSHMTTTTREKWRSLFFSSSAQRFETHFGERKEPPPIWFPSVLLDGTSWWTQNDGHTHATCSQILFFCFFGVFCWSNKLFHIYFLKNEPTTKVVSFAGRRVSLGFKRLTWWPSLGPPRMTYLLVLGKMFLNYKEINK